MNRHGTASAEGTSVWGRRLAQCFAGLDAAIRRHRENRGHNAVAAFAAAAEAAMWSTTLDDFYRKRHSDKSDYVTARNANDGGRTVRALSVYRNRIAHFIEVSHEEIRPGFSDEFSDAFEKYSHRFLPLDAVDFNDVAAEPWRDTDGERLYSQLVAGREIREVLARVEAWWALARAQFPIAGSPGSRTTAG